MAEHLGEVDTAREYRRLFGNGKAWTDEHLFNGEYYHQLVDLTDRTVLDQYFDPSGASSPARGLEVYWDEEHGEIKYQLGEGCGCDQVLAQWHANLYGLGDIFDPHQTKQALRSVFLCNFKQPMRYQVNPCRVYCLNDESGLLIATWPEGKVRPVIPMPYSQEAMNGFEYAAAVQMIQSGLVEEGMQVVEAIRDRYDGERRNPWNEFECGSNYARSMASYSLVNAFSGFRFDMVRSVIGFDPIAALDGDFRCFWSLDSGWGEIAIDSGRAELRVAYGELLLRALDLPGLKDETIQRVTLADEHLSFTRTGGEIRLARSVCIGKGESLVVLTRSD